MPNPERIIINASKESHYELKNDINASDALTLRKKFHFQEIVN